MPLTASVESVTTLQDALQAKLDEVETLVKQMPSKGDVGCECQRNLILNEVMGVRQCVNGIDVLDLVEEQDHD